MRPGIGPPYLKLGGGNVRYAWPEVRLWLPEQTVGSRVRAGGGIAGRSGAGTDSGHG